MILPPLTSDACSGISQETAHPKTLNRGNVHSYLQRAEEKGWEGDVKKKGETVISRWQSGMEKKGKEGKSTGSGDR